VNRAALLAAAGAIAIIWLPVRTAHGSDDKPVLNAVNDFFDAERFGDFNRMVLLLHPQTQRLFRDILSARTDVLLRTYPQEQISAVSGLPAHPKDLSLSDAEFFAFTCYNTNLRHPDLFGYDAKHFPFTLEGTTFDTEQRAHVVVSFPTSVQTERTSYNSIQSYTIFLKHERSGWFIWSSPFARSIGDLWSRDLASNNRGAPLTR
jgi:hypothetical protein